MGKIITNKLTYLSIRFKLLKIHAEIMGCLKVKDSLKIACGVRGIDGKRSVSRIVLNQSF